MYQYLVEILLQAKIVGVILIIVALILLAAPIKFETKEGYEQYNAFSIIISFIIRIFVTIWVVNIAKSTGYVRPETSMIGTGPRSMQTYWFL